MKHWIHSAIFLISIIATTLVFGLQQYVSLGSGIVTLPATTILLFSPEDMEGGPLAYLAGTIWIIFLIMSSPLLIGSVVTAIFVAAQSVIYQSVSHRFARLERVLQIIISGVWLIGLVSIDLFPVPQNPPIVHVSGFYLFPTIMLGNAWIMCLSHRN